MVYTDHTPLKAMLKAKHPSGKLVKWAEIISELDFFLFFFIFIGQ